MYITAQPPPPVSEMTYTVSSWDVKLYYTIHVRLSDAGTVSKRMVINMS